MEYNENKVKAVALSFSVVVSLTTAPDFKFASQRPVFIAPSYDYSQQDVESNGYPMESYNLVVVGATDTTMAMHDLQGWSRFFSQHHNYRDVRLR